MHNQTFSLPDLFITLSSAHATVSENDDPCMNYPQQQENVSSPITNSSHWVYREHQLVLTPHQQREIIPQRPDRNKIYPTSVHAKGDIQSNPSLCVERLCALTSSKYRPATYDLMEKLNHQSSFAATHRSSTSLSSVIQQWWPLTAVITTSTTTTTTTASPEKSPISNLTDWWTTTWHHVVEPKIKKRPEVSSPQKRCDIKQPG